MGLKKAKDTALHPVADRAFVRDTAGLLEQLHHADPGVRRWAARDLAQEPDAACDIGTALLTETDPSVRDALFTSLALIGGIHAVDSLLPLLRSDDAGLRNGAIEGLSQLHDDLTTRIDKLLRDPDSDVRILTVNLLGQLNHPQLGTWLRQVMLEDAAINVVAAAVEVVTEVGSTEHLSALKAARLRFADDPFIAFAIDVACTRIEAT